ISEVVRDVPKASSLLPVYFKGVKRVINAVSIIIGPNEGDTPDRAKCSQSFKHKRYFKSGAARRVVVTANILVVNAGAAARQYPTKCGVCKHGSYSSKMTLEKLVFHLKVEEFMKLLKGKKIWTCTGARTFTTATAIGNSLLNVKCYIKLSIDVKSRASQRSVD
ncbi:hypothetical protein Tco_0826533, partial [Tanacetum coccineum]